MMERPVEVLPDLLVTDDEVGVEIIFLEPEESPGEAASPYSLEVGGWQPSGWQMKRA
jgi:hypothetical protein